MRKPVLIILFLIFSLEGRTQFFTYYLEPFSGVNYSRYLRCEEPLIKKDGLGVSYGMKGTIDFTGYFSLNLTGGLITSYENGGFFQLGLNVPFYRIRSSGLTFFVEAGIELTNNDIKTPIYLGVKKQLDERFAVMTRFRPPTGLDTHYFSMTDNYLFGIELGMRIRLWADPHRKPVTRFGNPFLLN